MKKFLASAGVICCSFITLAANWVYDSSAKTLTRGSVVLQNVDANGKNLTINNNQSNTTATDLDFSVAIDDDYVLKNINGAAFNGNTNVQTLITPTSLVWIGYNAFSKCTGLTKLRLAEGLTSVGQQTFSECTALSDWDNKIPSTLTDASYQMFYGCTSLTGEVTIPEGIATYNAMFKSTGISKLTLTATTKIDGYACFNTSSSLSTIILSTNLTTIGASERIFGDLGAHNNVHLSIYWRSCPETISANIFNGNNNGIITNYLPWRLKSAWEDYAETTTGKNWQLTLPATYDGTGSWATANWNGAPAMVVKWWKDKPNGLRISIR